MTDTYVIYTQPNCGFCDKAKALLEQYGYEYIEMPLPFL
jgi:glutaredoxin